MTVEADGSLEFPPPGVPPKFSILRGLGGTATDDEVVLGNGGEISVEHPEMPPFIQRYVEYITETGISIDMLEPADRPWLAGLTRDFVTRAIEQRNQQALAD